MKLALIFLVSLVGLSVQQRLRYSPYIQYGFPQTVFPGYLFHGHQYARYQPPVVNPSENTADGDDDEFTGQIEGRMKPQSKLLWPWNNKLFNIGLDADDYIISTSTSTVFSTSPISTVTVASVQKCIAAAQFIAGSSTVNCVRRRRDVNVESETTDIDPSKVIPIVATVAQERMYQDVADIESSQDSSMLAQGGRRARNLLSTLTVTSTSLIPGYVFVTTTIKNNIVLVGAAALSCLPSGYTVC